MEKFEILDEDDVKIQMTEELKKTSDEDDRAARQHRFMTEYEPPTPIEFIINGHPVTLTWGDPDAFRFKMEQGGLIVTSPEKTNDYNFDFFYKKSIDWAAENPLHLEPFVDMFEAAFQCLLIDFFAKKCQVKLMHQHFNQSKFMKVFMYTQPREEYERLSKLTDYVTETKRETQVLAVVDPEDREKLLNELKNVPMILETVDIEKLKENIEKTTEMFIPLVSQLFMSLNKN